MKEEEEAGVPGSCEGWRAEASRGGACDRGPGSATELCKARTELLLLPPTELLSLLELLLGFCLITKGITHNLT